MDTGGERARTRAAKATANATAKATRAIRAALSNEAGAADAASAVTAVHIERADWSRLRRLPWGVPLGEWAEHGATILAVRKGESRHEVVFVEAGSRRYAIKETSPDAAQREIQAFEQARARGAPTLEPVGWLVVAGEPIEVGSMGGRPVYLSGDNGYCVTRLAAHALPQSILYRYPFTEPNKRLLWNAIAALLARLHDAGVYWGDPSLANVLIDLSDRRLSAVMADAETAEVVSGPLSEGMRRQDLEAFAESLAWQSEDIRLARGLAEETQLITESDSHYVFTRYEALRADRRRGRVPRETLFGRLVEMERRIERLGALGYGVLSLDGRGPHWGVAAGRHAPVGTAPFAGESGPHTELPRDDLAIATVRPGWYADRVRELLGERVPRAAAEAIYRQLNVHKYLLSQRAGHDVGMEVAARDWLESVHQPLTRFLEVYRPGADAAHRYTAYVGILNHTWQMSVSQGRAASIEEGAMDYALASGRAADTDDGG